MSMTHQILAHAASQVSALAAYAQTSTAAPTAPTFWMPIGASTISQGVDYTLDVINWICYVSFALVIGLMVWFVIKYRHRTGDKFRTDYPHHNTPLEITWSVIPTIIVIGIFVVGFRSYLDIYTAPKNAFDIKVTAQKWAWSFQYPNGAISDDLYVPAGRPVRLVLRSSDVLHALYIPDFRVKRDIVPGRYTYAWFQCDFPTGQPGKSPRDPNAKTVTGMEDPAQAHRLSCAEYCGTGHSKMNRYVYVLDEASFAQWMIDQSQWMDKIPEEELYFKAGPKIYARCQQCHSIDGALGIGPSWKGIVERVKAYPFVGEGKEYGTWEDYVRTSVLIPGKYVVPTYGNVMPSFKGQLNDKAIDAVIAYMQQLDKFDPKNGKLKPEFDPATGMKK
ncbi:MAG: cytochrome c oxidase subunit II [Planctomycetota bacterium]|nr:MAG: cytochrome c oxidase subunit II [Planctomycetota bacterium]